MSIPLDRLYHYIDNIAKEITDNIIIYRFYPHGSKKLEDLKELTVLETWGELALHISLYCNDQEPLNYKLYQNIKTDNPFKKILKLLSLDKDNNLKIKPTIYNKVCLLHSEQRSKNLIKYQNNQFIGVYYWSHAIIALDWFRFAQHVQQKKNVAKIFLIYNRAWSGTREYRLKFTDLLIKLGIEKDCQTTISSIEPELGIHYNQYQFTNPTWKPNHVFENYFSLNNSHSHYSADFNIGDYESTDIEVILETLFDDDRLHLTEKSLRPIACGQPFILGSTYGSLEYLRSYGFKTFSNVWDESYDLIYNPKERLIAITHLMKTITNWNPKERINKLVEAQIITDYNKKHFFSAEFFNQITAELKNNLQSAVNQVHETNSFKPFIDRWDHYLTVKEINNFLENPTPGQFTKKQVENVLKIAKELHQQQLKIQQE
jgi:hypothetical protein